MSSILSLLINLVCGTSSEPVPKHDLRKKPEQSLKDNLNKVFENNFPIIAVLAIIFLLIMFVIVCYMIVGISATDSGAVYNQWEAII